MKPSRHAVAVSIFSCAVMAALAGHASAATSDDFYSGKTLTVIVGSGAGGGYDANARVLARHIGDFIPGHPTVVVQNMPGAGSIVATNYIYNAAPKDGTVIGLIQRGNLMVKLTGQKVQFDPAKINWIGNMAAEPGLVVAWHTAPIYSAADLFKKEFVVGGTGVIGENEIIPRLLNRLIGTKFKVITGYPSNSAVLLAMQRGEVQGTADWTWSNIQRTGFLRDGQIRLLMLNSDRKEAELPKVPLDIDYAKNPVDRQALEIYFSLKGVARPVMAAPGIPPERIATLRDAFMKMANDPGFLKDAEASRLDASPTSGDSVENVERRIASVSPEVKRRLIEGMAPPKTAEKSH